VARDTFRNRSGDLPIIDVFRLSDGKILEIWNHQHDTDTLDGWVRPKHGVMARTEREVDVDGGLPPPFDDRGRAPHQIHL
jgi:hypothetical protein